MSEAGETGALHRTIVVGLVWNRQGDLLFCRMSPDRGVFPGQWGFPGGGIEPGERMEPALRRELREELGDELRLNDEFVEYRWLGQGEVDQLDLNQETVDTLARLGSWPAA